MFNPEGFIVYIVHLKGHFKCIGCTLRVSFFNICLYLYSLAPPTLGQVTPSKISIQSKQVASEIN